MKHHLRKVITIILVASILISCFSVVASAYTTITPVTEPATYNSVAHHHFEKTPEVPENVNGSCTYVAASMLLSFYDSYWSDAFVSENYEDSFSPSSGPYQDYPNGVPRILLENSAWENYQTSHPEGSYADFISSDNRFNTYLHLNLISISIAAGYIELNDDEDDDDEDYGTSLEELAEVLNIYFNSIFGVGDYYLPYGESDSSLALNIHVLNYNSSESSRDTVLQIMEEQVSVGNPVILGGTKNRTNDTSSAEQTDTQNSNDMFSSHAMIAYNITDNGDIDIHTGWNDNRLEGHEDELPRFSISPYQRDLGILWIEINEDVLPHSCTNNYNYRTSSAVSNNPDCSCKAYSTLHPAHTHTVENNTVVCSAARDDLNSCSTYCSANTSGLHNYNIVGKSYTSHWKECLCGAKKDMTTHNYNIALSNDSNHSSKCECGEVNHQYIIKTTAIDHWLECKKCGTTTEEKAHVFHGTASLSSTQHLAQCSCGVTTQEEHNFEYRAYDNENHYEKCSCGEKTNILPHSISYSNITDTVHTETCDCKYYCEDKPHEFSNFTYINSNYHQVSCACGQNYYQQHDWRFVSAKYDVCAICNHRRNRNGGIEETFSITPEENDS